jgi:hypothetical protein
VAALTSLTGGAALAASLIPLVAGLVLLAITHTRSAKSAQRRDERENQERNDEQNAE